MMYSFKYIINYFTKFLFIIIIFSYYKECPMNHLEHTIWCKPVFLQVKYINVQLLPQKICTFVIQLNIAKFPSIASIVPPTPYQRAADIFIVPPVFISSMMHLQIGFCFLFLCFILNKSVNNLLLINLPIFFITNEMSNRDLYKLEAALLLLLLWFISLIFQDRYQLIISIVIV